MKKILTFLTGIVFLITILIVGSCKKDANPDDKNQKEAIRTLVEGDTIDNPKRVKIYVKDTLIDGNMHLKMYDSNEPDTVVVDTLHRNDQFQHKKPKYFSHRCQRKVFSQRTQTQIIRRYKGQRRKIRYSNYG